MSYTITERCNGCLACAKICPVSAISGEKKQVHTIDPSWCIDCGACGRVCPQGALLDNRGMVCAMMKRSQWKKPRIDRRMCMSCTICVDACPVNSLSLTEAMDARDLHLYPFLQKDTTCLGCSICALECPMDAINMVGNE
jgi:formate hydrogenlyase subunit 6/NADH:ubiquinone oxidoreductase subunit I